MLIASAPANLAVATDSLPLYIAGGVFFMGAIVFVLAMSLGATAAALRPAAHVWWTWRDGETGPWSRGSRRATAAHSTGGRGTLRPHRLGDLAGLSGRLALILRDQAEQLTRNDILTFSRM
jgi:hypothetical protein